MKLPNLQHRELTCTSDRNQWQLRVYRIQKKFMEESLIITEMDVHKDAS